MFKVFLTMIFAVLLLGCVNISPSPLLSHWALNKNNEFTKMVLKCTQGPNYTPEVEGCDPIILKNKSQELVDLSLALLEADNIQSQGFDIYLHTTMVILRIDAENCKSLQITFEICVKQEKNYSLVEKVAEQFFQTEKAYGGRDMPKAHFWRVYFVTSNVGLKYRLGIFSPDEERKAYLQSVLENQNPELLQQLPEYRRLYLSYLKDLDLLLKNTP